MKLKSSALLLAVALLCGAPSASRAATLVVNDFVAKHATPWTTNNRVPNVGQNRWPDTLVERQFSENVMRRYCQLIHLHPEAREEYIRYHAQVWPSVLATIDSCNIRNYSIFLHDDLLIAYFEYHGADYAADMRRMAADPETQRWWSIMDPMQQPLPNVPADHRWLDVPEVFHFDGTPLSSAAHSATNPGETA